ncbi:uncharacterized protein JN550_013775 [Neoarthrinium moseri]|uniref:uncharacterized protein n=1 Tax=Neoarthrinium moseri TaxID=1658444 RepID=UPI001FDE8D54|nr:uncharacterized protein JN550_013775 [Neoarthrinium moseri]KAI1856513.1 hypothetical protein JN550_013775 [Neoarthrinium moseri]
MVDSINDRPSTYTSFFQESLETVPRAISEVLESYSHVPKDAQVKHIVKVRNAAYKRCPYPCIGNMRFLDFDLSAHPLYQEYVLEPLKRPKQDGEAEPLFLDLGSCFGQDLRKLVYDGAPVERLWASDIDQYLIDMGFELFNDEDRLPKERFLCPGDLLSDSPEDRLNVLDGKVTILHMTAVFHLFTYEDQKKVVDRCLRLLRKDSGGPVLLLGMQVGSVIAGPFLRENMTQEFSHKYRHNVESWKQLWNGVAQGDEWKERIRILEVKSTLLERNTKPKGSGENPNAGDGQMRRHIFEVRVTFH